MADAIISWARNIAYEQLNKSRFFMEHRSKVDQMYNYSFRIDFAGNVTSGTFECDNNEDSKRTVMKTLKGLGIPEGKYVFVDIIRLDDNKEIVSEELWKA